MNTLGIYIHVPFCGKKCGYCDFYSASYNKQKAEDYVAAVIKNIAHYSDRSRSVDTVYFGGGTPSLLTPQQLNNILDSVGGSFQLENSAEITIEANPCTLAPDKLRSLRSSGINRLSIGVQSLLDDELKMLERVHSSQRAIKAVNDAHDAGFENISCDIMLGLPHQTPDKLLYTLENIVMLPIKHISAYILKTEPGTPFDSDEIKNQLPDEDAVSDLYMLTCEKLENSGFMQYEISNFAVPGYESKHNCRYWKCQDYLGIGPAAHSCYEGRRFAVPRDLVSFINSDIQPFTVTDDSPCGFEEFAMLRLRLKEGLKLSDVPEHRIEIEKKMPALINAGYADFDGETISLTRKGFLMSNSVIEYLVF